VGEECVIDTRVLQSANAPLTSPPRPGSLFTKRIQLLIDLRAGARIALRSRKLIDEYTKKVPKPRNDYVKVFFEILTDPAKSISNWAKWTGSQRDKAHKTCRYPGHDDHLLRTAIRPNGSTIITEEAKLIATDECIHRTFGVHIRHVAGLY
jgi:hypothetical protein